MHNRSLMPYVKWHDQLLRGLHDDEEGLSILAYAFGAGLILAPLVVALALFGPGSAEDAQAEVEAILP